MTVSAPSVPQSAVAAAAGDTRPARGHGADTPRLRVIDGLRFIAALTVVFYHYTASGDRFWHSTGAQQFQLLRHATEYGWLGINLFFLISGFVICMSSWGRGLGDYFTSRVVRLYPAYFFGIIFSSTIIRLLPTPGVDRLKFTQILLNFTMVQTGMNQPNADGPYWTLWRELLFYILFAIVVWRGVDYRRTVQFCIIWTMASVVVGNTDFVVLRDVIDNEFSHYFIAGVAMFLIYRFGPNLLLLSIVGFSWILAVSQARGTIPFMANMIHGSATWTVGVGIITTFFAIMLATSLGWFDWVQWRWLTTAGVLTYPLYLIHGNAGVSIIYHLSPRLPKYVLLVGLICTMLLLAWLVHRFVERPAAARLRRSLRRAIDDLRANSTLSKSSAPQPQQRQPTTAPENGGHQAGRRPRAVADRPGESAQILAGAEGPHPVHLVVDERTDHDQNGLRHQNR